MLQDGTSIFCERCGHLLPVSGPLADAHYCVSCRLYACGSCWNSTALRCTGCAEQAVDGGRGPSGLKAARRSMSDLRGVRAELLAISAREAKTKDALRPEDLRIARLLLTIRAESASAAAHAAIERVRTPDMAQRLRRDVDAEMRSIAAVWRPPPEAQAQRRWLPTLGLPAMSILRSPTLRFRALLKLRLPAQPTLRLPGGWPPIPRLPSISLLTVRLPALRLPTPRGSTLWPPAPMLGTLRLPTVRKPARGAIVIASAALSAALVGVVLVASLNTPPFQSGPRDPGPPALSEGAREGVAGGTPSREPAPTVRPEARDAIHMAFDELVMGADVSGLWDTVAGGGGVEVAPFPNAVDRSLKLTSSPSGDPTTLCESVSAVDAMPLRVSADLLIAGGAEGASVRLELDDAAIGLVIRAGGVLGIEPVGRLVAGTVAAAQWYRVVLTLDPDRGTYRVTATPRNGDTIDGAEQSLSAMWRSSPSDPRLCISGPAVAGAELFLDNVAIE